jgi:hypothetical protein
MKFRDIEPPHYVEHVLLEEFTKLVKDQLQQAKANYYDEDTKGRKWNKAQIDFLTQMLSDYEYEIIIKQTKKESNNLV